MSSGWFRTYIKHPSLCFHHLLGSGGQIHMKSWVEIGKVCSNRPKGMCLRRDKDINWAIDLVLGMGKEFLYSS